MEPIIKSTCPLCHAAPAVLFHQDRRRCYLRCPECALIFVLPEYFLTTEAEKAEYDLHENSPDDPGYRRFLSRIFMPLLQNIPPGSRGLDFGCGPGPTLSLMFEEAGCPMAVYDHFYAREPGVFSQKYQFITATEVVEHLHKPRMELERLWRCLVPGGVLGIMTKLALEREEFARWHYKNDFTHVCFFSRTTFRWLAAEWQAEITFPANDVIFIHKLN